MISATISLHIEEPNAMGWPSGIKVIYVELCVEYEVVSSGGDGYYNEKFDEIEWEPDWYGTVVDATNEDDDDAIVTDEIAAYATKWVNNNRIGILQLIWEQHEN